jgi:F0F1-type ATP synthase assembly protein I
VTASGVLAMFPGNTDRKGLGKALALSQIGMEMVIPIGLGLVVDYYMKWLPWATVVGAVLGLIGGLAHLVQLTKKDERHDETEGP